MAVPLIGPDGREYVLPDDSKLQAALDAGFRQPGAEGRTTEEALKGTAADVYETGLAAVEGAGRGMTAGLSDVIEAAPPLSSIIAPETPEEKERREAETRAIKTRKEQHPYAAGAGELVGMIRSPVGLVGRGVKSAIGAETALGRIGAGITAGTAEGVLFGAGNTLSESALGNTELTAEKLIAGAGLVAMLGGVGGGVGSVLDEAISFAIPRVARMVGTRALDELADSAAVKAARSQQDVINRLRPDQVQAAGRVIRERGHLGSPKKMLKSLEDDIAKVGGELGAIREAADQSAKVDYPALFGRIDDLEATLNPAQLRLLGSDLKNLRSDLQKLATPTTPTGTQVFGNTQGGFKALDDLRQSWAKNAKFSKGPTPIDDETLGLKRQLAGVLRDEIDKQLVPQLGPDIGRAYGEAKNLFGALKDAAKLAKSGAGRVQPSGLGFGMYDLLAAVAGGALHPAGIGLAVANKFMREQGPALVAKAADAISKSPTLKMMANSFAQKVPTVSTNLGQYAAPLAQAIGRSPEFGLATHVVMAQTNPDYATKAAQAGFLAETGAEKGAAVGKAQGLLGVAAALKDTDEAISKGVDKVFKASGRARGPDTTSRQDFGTKRMRRTGAEAHGQRMKEIAELAANPEALLERIEKNLGDLGSAAPAVSAAATNVTHRAVAYLAAQIQRPPKPGPLAPEWHFPKTDLFLFSKKLETVEEPLSILEHAAAGTLTKPQVEALQAVYPTVFAQIRDTALNKLAGSPRGVPYKAKLMLGLLTGVDPDGTLSATSTNQQAYAAMSEQQQEQPPPQADSGKLKGSALAMATPDQRRELRRDSEA